MPSDLGWIVSPLCPNLIYDRHRSASDFDPAKCPVWVAGPRRAQPLHPFIHQQRTCGDCGGMSAWCPLAILSGDGKPHGQGISAVALEGALHELIINKFNTSEHHLEPTFRTGGCLCRVAGQYRRMLGVGHGSGLALTCIVWVRSISSRLTRPGQLDLNLRQPRPRPVNTCPAPPNVNDVRCRSFASF